MYRNDYDAAVARIDALEEDIEQLRAERNHLVRELVAKRQAANKRPLGKLLSGLAVAVMCAGALYLRVHHSQTASAEPATHMDAYGAIDNAVARTCELP